MLFRKIEAIIRNHFECNSDKILLVEGARQVGKSYIIRHVGSQLFPNFIEINLAEDKNGPRNFENVRTLEEFFLILGALAGDRLSNAKDTLIFLDEIQEYPPLLTLLKFLRQDNRYSYIASGSLLGITLKRTVSIPVGSIRILKMYPLDFEEFLIANKVGEDVVAYLKDSFEKKATPLKPIHERVMDLFKRYLITGGMPDAVNEFLNSRNVVKIREIQRDIHTLYADDASKYDEVNKLKIRRIYNLLPSVLAQKKKRLVFKDIEDIKGKRSRDYMDEIDYLVDSGVTLPVKAISNPKFPLIQSEEKNLLKLYLNDVGILSSLLYANNIKPIIDNETSVNLGALYECVAAMELTAHNHTLYYYDNKKYGEVDFLIDDYSSLSVLPVEIKSGKDYYVHSALSRLLGNKDYGISKGVVLSNHATIESVQQPRGEVLYLPIYMCMFLANEHAPDNLILI